MKQLTRTITLLSLAVNGVAFAQTASKSAAAQRALSVDDVSRMAQAGLSDDVIIGVLRQNNRPLSLSAGDLIGLKKAKVSDEVLKAMLAPAAPVNQPISPTPPVPAAILPQSLPPSEPTPREPAGGRPGSSPKSGGFLGGILDAAEKE